MQTSPQALNWLGARELLAMWQPDTEAGASAARSWPSLDEAAWAEERQGCLLLDGALADGRLEASALREHLRGLPAIDAVSSAAAVGATLDAAQLFRAKQVVYAALRLRVIVAAVAGYPLPEEGPLQAAYEMLHRPGDPVARFVLSSSRSEALAVARAAETEAHRLLLAARASGDATTAERAHADARARLLAVEAEELASLSRSLGRVASALQQAGAWTTTLDLRLAKCRLRDAWGGCWPEPAEDLSVEDGLHPVVASRVSARGGTFVRQRFVLPSGVSMLTGANMGGKTVALQLAGLVLLCGASGLPAPAGRATFPRVDFLEVLAGTEQGSRHGLSSFGSEVVAWRALLSREGRGFVLADEPARTTSPDEGAALVEGLCEALAARGWRGWVATHFGDAGLRAAVSSWAVGGLQDDAAVPTPVAEGSLAALESRMDYRLAPSSGAARSDAFRVAEALGLGDEVLRTARRRLASVESSRNRSS